VKSIKKRRISAKTLVLGGALLTTIGLGALGIVWLRVEISSAALEARKLEKQVSESARELRGLNEKRAKALNPASLKALVAGRLAKPNPSLVYFVDRTELQRRQSLPPPTLMRMPERSGIGPLPRLALR